MTTSEKWPSWYFYAVKLEPKKSLERVAIYMQSSKPVQEYAILARANREEYVRRMNLDGYDYSFFTLPQYEHLHPKFSRAARLAQIIDHPHNFTWIWMTDTDFIIMNATPVEEVTNLARPGQIMISAKDCNGPNMGSVLLRARQTDGTPTKLLSLLPKLNHAPDDHQHRWNADQVSFYQAFTPSQTLFVPLKKLGPYILGTCASKHKQWRYEPGDVAIHLPNNKPVCRYHLMKYFYVVSRLEEWDEGLDNAVPWEWVNRSCLLGMATSQKNHWKSGAKFVNEGASWNISKVAEIVKNYCPKKNFPL